ncbi:MAG: hypothetical protein H6Q89_2006 [Myxococcaceae bacterium]|nr:hypothetical protein [Myxococcaceae bacterium]
MSSIGMIRAAVVAGSLLVSAAAVGQESSLHPIDAPLVDDAFEGEGPSSTPVANLTRRAMREEREWLLEQQASIGDFVRPSIFLTIGAAGSVFGAWWLGEFMRMNPAYRSNAEWLAIGTMAAGAILSGTMAALIGLRWKRRAEYQERVEEIRDEFRRRHAASTPLQPEPDAPPPPPPTPPPAPEFLTPPPPPPPSLAE